MHQPASRLASACTEACVNRIETRAGSYRGFDASAFRMRCSSAISSFLKSQHLLASARCFSGYCVTRQ